MGIKNIIEKEESLQARPKSIKQMLKSVVANQKMQAKRVPAGNDKIIFCFTDSKITDLGQFASENIHERFKTINAVFIASYFEIWDRKDRKNFCLNKMYFHLYNVEEDRESKEYILLHTDPNDDDKTHGDYKRSPHLHIKNTSDDKIGHAHFSLNNTDYEKVMSSIEELDKCFTEHIKMLANQIL